jgi:hypothetical protein
MDHAVGFARQRRTRESAMMEESTLQAEVEGYQTSGSCTEPSGGRLESGSVNRGPSQVLAPAT